MLSQTKRAGITLLIVVVVIAALASVAAAAAADTSGGADTNETAFDSENRSSAAHNETLTTLDIGLSSGGLGGNGHLDCIGEAATGHDCEKGGLLDLNVASVDYDGAMGGTVTEFQYWFDDHFVVNALGLETEVALSCDLSTDDVDCPVDPDVETSNAETFPNGVVTNP